MAKFIVNTDGGARGNPGPAAVGVVLTRPDGTMENRQRTIGRATNNQAEYRALLLACHLITGWAGTGDHVEFRLDSELVVNQMKGEYKVKDEDLRVLWQQVNNTLSAVDFTVSFVHIPREENQAADKLVNDALDKE